MFTLGAVTIQISRFASPVRPTVRAAMVLAVVAGTAMFAGCGDIEAFEFTRRSTTTVDRGELGVDLDLPTTTLPSMRPARYEVQPGDSLGSIATRFGLTIDSLLAANGLDNPNALEAGTILNIPGPNATTPPPWRQRENRDSTRGR